MRWALVRICLAATAMVVASFAVPLGFVVRDMVRDRAETNAERQAAALTPVLSITTDRGQLAKALASTQAGATERMAVHLPRTDGEATAAGPGRVRAAPQAVAAARDRGQAGTAPVPGGVVLLRPTAVGNGVAVVEVFVPDAEMSNGVGTAWLILSGVAVALIVGSVAVADRLGRRVVRSARRLAEAARELGVGRLSARVREDGPPELRAAGGAFNAMADQVVQLLAAERELAADLSHRLRTPLTVLRLNTASLGDGPAAWHTREAVRQLEGEVDTIIRTAREQRPQPAQEGAPSEGIGCDAAEVIQERMSFWSALAEDEGRRVSLGGVGEVVRVPVRRPDLAAALDAMLGNVFRHTSEGTAFAVDVHTTPDAVIVLVSDAGEGIPDPAAALRRGNSGRQQGSTGLGLDIVRKLAESTGGDVRIGRSALGGAEIRLWICRDIRLAAAQGPRRTHRLATRHAVAPSTSARRVGHQSFVGRGGRHRR
ncbi:ATP-binding protein [Streptomyces sp. NPDC056149]|uniref:HAMP domain-containing sensor histidine kinase n=1 Tax=Streptomyces sp. NPDC056149 TaxID=3345728 RepID=UPI0035D9B806